jgi:hypothetical protein
VIRSEAKRERKEGGSKGGKKGREERKTEVMEGEEGKRRKEDGSDRGGKKWERREERKAVVKMGGGGDKGKGGRQIGKLSVNELGGRVERKGCVRGGRVRKESGCELGKGLKVQYSKGKTAWWWRRGWGGGVGKQGQYYF